MARKTIVTLEPNIRRDDFGIEAAVRVGALARRRKRYPFTVWDTEAGRQKVRAWVIATRSEMEQELRQFGVPVNISRGSLEDKFVEFVRRLRVYVGAVADVSHLRAWLSVTLPDSPLPLARWQLEDIDAGVIDRVIKSWQESPTASTIRQVRVTAYHRDKRGQPNQIAARPIAAHVRTIPATSGKVVAARTIRHRCRMLLELFRMVHGPKAPTPFDRVQNVPATPKRKMPVIIPEDVLFSTLGNLRLAQPVTFARYAVACTTLQRPCQVGSADPDDVDLEDRAWVVRDAKNEPAHTIELGDDAVAAWRAFIAVSAWGDFDTSKYGKHIHKAGLPKHLRPYQARHTGAVAAIVARVPIAKLQEQLGHLSIDTTRIYAGFIRDASREVADKIGGRFKTVFTPRLVRR